jgi:hypothetical protein
MSTKPPIAERVFRRAVFFVPGFNPVGPKFYYELFRRELELYSRSANVLCSMTDIEEGIQELCAWRVDAQQGGVRVEVTVTVLTHHSSVLAHWPKSPIHIIRDVVRYGWAYAASGLFLRVLRISKRTFITLISPFLLIFALLVGSTAVALLVVATLYFAAGFGSHSIPSIAAASLSSGLLLWFGFARPTSALWLGRIYAFLLDEALDRTPAYELRKSVFVNEILSAAQRSAWDEILIVGFSSGACLAVSVLARCLERRADLGRSGPSLSLLTIGSVVPLLAGLPAAGVFRRELRDCAISRNLTWVDVSSVVDPIGCPSTDPLAFCGIERTPGAAVSPRLISARFHKSLDPKSYARVRRNAMSIHTQFLRAPHYQGEFNYFDVTTGNMTLARRYNEPP